MVTRSESPARQRFEILDGLRGVAAFSVLLGHASKEMTGTVVNPNMVLSVPFFFTLSGFVLSYAYPALPVSAYFRYAGHRVIRLFPMIVLAAALGSACLVYRHVAADLRGVPTAHVVAGIVSGFTTLPSPFMTINDWRWPANYPEWSLFFELAASAALALVLSRLPALALAGIVAVAAAATSKMFLETGGVPAGLTGQAEITAFAFTSGCLLYRLARPRPNRLGWPTLALVLIFTAYLFAPVEFGVSVGVVALIVAVPALTWLASHGRPSERLAPICSFLGDLSYPVYIVHAPILIGLKLLMPSLSGPWAAALGIVVVTVLAWVALKTCDEPVRRALRTSFDRRWPKRETGRLLHTGRRDAPLRLRQSDGL